MAKRKSKASAVVGIAPAVERDWQTEDDLRTLIRAREIKNDAKRLKAARALAKKQLAELGKITSEGAKKP